MIPGSDRLLTRPFALLVSAHFLQALGYSSMLMLPLYLDFLGASRTEIGTAMAVSAVGSLLLRPAVGWALDTVGRKPVLFAGTATLIVGMLLVGAIDRMGPLVYGMRLIVGVGVGVLFAGYFTLAADQIPESRRTEGLALFGISGLLPLFLHPFAERVVGDPSQLRWFFPIVGAAIALSLLPLIFIPDPGNHRRPEPIRFAEARDALLAPPLFPVWTATGFFAGLVSVFMAFVLVVAESRGMPNPATIWFTYAGGAVSVRFFGARLPDRVGPAKVGFVALGCYIAGFFGVAAAVEMHHFLIAGACAGVGHGYCFPVVSGQVVTRSPARLRGIAIAMFTGMWGVGGLALTPIFGAIADARGDTVMMQSAGAFGAFGLVLWMLLERRYAPRAQGA